MRDVAVEEVFAALRAGGRDTYAGEEVSVTDHSLQAAAAAHQDGASAALTAATLLHDIGWVIRTGSRRHELRGSAFLAEFFEPAVTEPVRLHVLAKRYLCTIDEGYRSMLSSASLRTLVRQGDTLDDQVRSSFEAEPYAADAIRLRRYDDQAKVLGAETADLAQYAPLISQLLHR